MGRIVDEQGAVHESLEGSAIGPEIEADREQEWRVRFTVELTTHGTKRQLEALEETLRRQVQVSIQKDAKVTFLKAFSS